MEKKKIWKEERFQVLVLVLAAFVLLTAWAFMQPLGAGPDEKMRYMVAQYLHNIRENFLSEMILPSGMPPGEFPMPIIPFFPIWYLLYLWELQVCSMLLPTDFSMRQEWQMCFL